MTDLLVQAFAAYFNDRLYDNAKPRPEQMWEAKGVPVPAQYLSETMRRFSQPWRTLRHPRRLDRLLG
ncbi:hypothetical protein ACFVKB_15670 [Rhodococcus sp. NPDC127530]|uniref:hypothetical protein n=1 Tax=unclassified Rhodococcus (in: high G+C Gram-positive bacteria) TaxID=192944 RepID=UPI003638BBB0